MQNSYFKTILGAGILIGAVALLIVTFVGSRNGDRVPSDTTTDYWQPVGWKQNGELTPTSVPKDVPERTIPATVGFAPDEVIPFDQIITQSPDAKFQAVLDQIYLDSYILFPCASDQGDTNVLMWTAKYTEVPGGLNTFEPARETINRWRADVAPDIGVLLFPHADVVASGRGGYQTTADSDMSKTTILVDGSNQEVYMGWLLNYVFMGSSQSCVAAAMDTVYSPGTH